MNNLDLYNKVRQVPIEAQKQITGGRLKGMTDINPMWRIKTLTDNFGPCGFGWFTEITKQWIEDGAKGEKVAFVNINLFIKIGTETSMPIAGTGGSSFVTEEKNGLYTSDEAFKMAYTDAISVACKSLGIGADIYWEKDSTKYDNKKLNNDEKPNQNNQSDNKFECSECHIEIAKKVYDYSMNKFEVPLCYNCQKKSWLYVITAEGII